ncbi:MAG: single-stranded-DNA-specific exonuclease RecJ [Rhodospirillaceae bacterium]
MDPVIIVRTTPPDAMRALCDAGIPPLLARVYAARGITSPDQLSDGLDRLHRPDAMLNMRRMAGLLADALAQRRRLLIVADYDADGATACAVGLRALRAFGADAHYIVPNRFEYGYGLTPEIVQLAHRTHRPDVLITVDNGIASVDGVAEANRLGMQVLITDHHLPGDTLPDAWCIINPNQPGCSFPSKHLAGVGVMFYLMLALRAELKDRRAFEGNGPNLATLLDLVALGTVADVVQLDDNNRRLVQQGLKRMRAGRCQPGVAALFRAAGRDMTRASAYDLGFALGPRLNAAGRLTDMTLGIECLTTDDEARAGDIARELDALNRERRDIEADMQDAALAAIEAASCGEEYTLSLFHPDWHQGVIGIVASRIKDRYHRPTIAFARGNEGEIKGSARSIPGLHMRDALDLVTKRHPGLILKFGGHAAAAGLTLRESDFPRFRSAFEETVRALVSPSDLERQIETDGSLALEDATLEAAAALAVHPWGSGFPEPRFHDCFEVAGQRVVGGRHLRLKLVRDTRSFDAMLFGTVEPLPPRIAAVYRLEVNEFQSTRSLQLTLHHWSRAV